MVLDVMRRMKADVGETTALYGLVTGPFTLASHLRGTEIFMDMFDHPDFLRDLIAYALEVAKRMAELYIEAGMDVIAIVDPLVSQISPRTSRSCSSRPTPTSSTSSAPRASSPPSLSAATRPRIST